MLINRMVAIAITTMLLFGCVSNEERLAKELTSYYSGVQTDIQQLKHHLKAGRIRNAELLEKYADVVIKQKPDMAPIVKALAADATTEGPLFQSLVTRLKDAEKEIHLASQRGESGARALATELRSLGIAADVSNFNMMLTDPINVLADMSEGKLARVTDMAKDAASSSSQAAVGGELVGNPHYGQWQTNASGSTFWEWYGKYALFSSLIDGSISYSRWSTYRRPSYYHDVGRSHYSSPAQTKQYQRTEQRVKKQFASKGKSFQSPYAKTTASKASLSTPTKYSGARFNSQYSKSKTSAYNSRSKGSGSRSYGSGGK